MPSGAKKRKAAKKKKDKEANINSSTTSHGNDDLKTQDSDGGEVSSPVSQKNNQDRPFDEDDKRDHPPPVRSIVHENTAVEDAQKVAAAEDVESKDVESDDKSFNRSSSSRSSSTRSSSSSDDESRVASEPVKFSEEAYNSVMETEPLVDSVKLVEPVVEKVIPLTGIAPFETSLKSDVAVLGTKEKDEQLLPSLDENTVASVTVIDIESNEFEFKVLPLSYDNDVGSSSANHVTTKENGSKLYQSSIAPILETSTSTCEEQQKDFEIPEENRPLVSAAPLRVQTTSWKSCCGLFEVITGSNI